MENNLPKSRCPWAKSDLDIHYHDIEWAVPMHDDGLLFEMLILEGMQAGLSWSTVLTKRAHYRKVLDNFDYLKIAKYDETKLASLMQDAGIIRNRLKIASLVTNAKAFIEVQNEYGSFDKFLWSFVNYQTIFNHFANLNELPSSTPISDELSKTLKKRGFKFVGTTICYAYMQAIGMVNDHVKTCFKYQV